MRKKAISLALALALCLGLLPVTASAAEAGLSDWYFLFAIFKNVDADGKDEDGKAVHVTYSMSQKEVDIARENAREFEAAMNSFGVMRAHVDVVEIDTTVTEMRDSNASDRKSGTRGSFLDSPQAAPLLEGQVDLDKYDHVTCVISLNDLHTTYMGITGSAFENGVGHSCVNFVNEKYALERFTPGDGRWPPSLYIHEYLHFMERMSLKWGFGFGLHLIGDKLYAQNNENYTWKTCYTDIILNRVKGDAETGTGVHPTVWTYPPHVFRTMTEWNVPSGVASIGEWAFQGYTSLTKVTIPGSVTSIGKVAFRDCSSLQSVTISAGVASIETWAFGNCTALTTISIPASVTSIGYAAFYNTGLKDVYYGGTEAQWKAVEIDAYNDPLAKANIHYNSTGPSGGTTQPSGSTASNGAKVSGWAKDRVDVALASGLAPDGLGNDYQANITRAQFAATAVKLYAAMGGTATATGTSSFTDTSDTTVLLAADLGFVSGVGDGKFAPSALVTREQAAVMLSNVFAKLGGSIPTVSATSFADDRDVASWARNAVAFMNSKEIVAGVGNNNFSPKGNASIEQALLIALKMLETLK